MSPSVVLLAVQQGDPSVLVTVAVATATEGLARCIPQPAASVVNRQKSRSSLAAINRYTAAIAIIKSE
jgi:hypothetical protein